MKIKKEIELNYKRGIKIETTVLEERVRFGRKEILVQEIKLLEPVWMTK